MNKLFEGLRSLNETVTDIVFHYTLLDNFFKILTTDRFMTSVAFATFADKKLNKGKLYFFSTARTKTGAYGSNRGWQDVCLVLDGQKLSQRYKGVAVDYWGRDYGARSFESEDRIITDKPFIEKASSYIIEAHLNMDNMNKDHTKVYWEIREDLIEKAKNVLSMLEERGIPFWIYTHEQQYKNLTKKAHTSFESWFKEVRETQEVGEPWGAERGPSADRYDRIKCPAEIVDALERDDYESLSTEAKKYLYRLRNYTRDKQRELEIEIHNTRKDPEGREYVHKIASTMRKWKTPELSEFVAELAKRVSEKEWRGEY